MHLKIIQQAEFETIFVGGGTPTLLMKSNWSRFCEAINATYYLLTKMREFTFEANPDDLQEKIEDITEFWGESA